MVDEIVKDGGKAVAVQGDVSKATDVKRIFAETEKAFGKLDVLVNNAGVYQFAPLGEITEEQFHRQFNTNVMGLILATQEAVKHFGTEGGDRYQHRLDGIQHDAPGFDRLHCNQGRG